MLIPVLLLLGVAAGAGWLIFRQIQDHETPGKGGNASRSLPVEVALIQRGPMVLKRSFQWRTGGPGRVRGGAESQRACREAPGQYFGISSSGDRLSGNWTTPSMFRLWPQAKSRSGGGKSQSGHGEEHPCHREPRV